MKKRKSTTRFNCSKLKNQLENKSSILDRSEYTLNLVNSWIIEADTKVSISCAVSSVVIAAVVFVEGILLRNIDKTSSFNDNTYLLFIVFFILTVIFFVGSQFFYLLAINPSFLSDKGSLGKVFTKKQKKGMEKVSFSIFYEDISKFENKDDYLKVARKISEEKFIDEVLKEIYFNSIICSRKMKRFKSGVLLSSITIVFCLITGVLYYCAYCV